MFRFAFDGFLPRWAFRKAANQWLSQLMNSVPKGAQCQAHVRRHPAGYCFEVQLEFQGGKFKSTIVLDESQIARTAEDWQVEEVQRIGTKVTADVEAWMKKNAHVSRSGGKPSSKGKTKSPKAS